MSPIFVPHVFWSISSRAASQSKPPVSSVHGNRRCQSWSSPIVEVVSVTSSPNKKAPTLLFSYCCTSDARRRSVRFPIPPRCFDCPACRAAPVDLLAVPVLHYGGWRRRLTAWLKEMTDGMAGGDDRRRTSSPLPTPSAAQRVSKDDKCGDGRDMPKGARQGAAYEER